MKQTFILGSAIIAAVLLVSCNKIEVSITSNPIKVSVSTEIPNAPQTKVSINEDGSNFSLNWEGTETFGLANSTNTAYKTDWSVNSYTGTSAVLEGSLVDVSGDNTNWVMSTNFFSSTGGAIRANIPVNQAYNGTTIAQNCLLVARADGASTSTIPSLNFKTMNAFIKFSLKKGSAAGGSSNEYTKMYVQSITVETLGSENVAGRFEISKTAADWMDNYSGTVDGQMSDHVTLDCTVQDAKGEELSAVAKDFYVAVAFGSYASGVKVTINVQNQDGDAGTYERTIGASSGITIDRNTLLAMAEVTVNPVDAVSPTTYTLIDDPSDVEAGTYYLAAKYGDSYYLWTGSITTSSNKDMITAEYTYNTSTHVLTGSGAVEVTLVATDGGYFVKYGDNYLRVTANTNRRVACDGTSDVWSFDVSKNGGNEPRGGLKMTEANNSNTIVSANTSSNVLRSYTTATQGNYGVYLFKQD